MPCSRCAQLRANLAKRVSRGDMKKAIDVAVVAVRHVTTSARPVNAQGVLSNIQAYKEAQRNK